MNRPIQAKDVVITIGGVWITPMPWPPSGWIENEGGGWSPPDHADELFPFRVRASCGHPDVRPMRESVARVAFDPEADWQLDAPSGRRCAACRAASPRGDGS